MLWYVVVCSENVRSRSSMRAWKEGYCSTLIGPAVKDSRGSLRYRPVNVLLRPSVEVAAAVATRCRVQVLCPVHRCLSHG
jgi:hypothetical protein